MEKVKITQEQADAIESIREGNGLTEANIRKQLDGDWWDISARCDLNKLSIEEFLNAYYVGYEVEEEFKVGDWIHTTYEDGEVRIGSVLNFIFGSQPYTDNNHIGETTHRRHATPEEIATEKQRRFFAKNNREVWELKSGDIVRSQFFGPLEVVECADGSLSLDLNDTLHDIHTDKDKVVCFAEDRKDI